MSLRAICILCSPEDKHALWLAIQLRAREWQVELIQPEELLIRSGMQLRITSGQTESILHLARGMTIDNQLGGVINRLFTLPPLHSESGRQADSLYLEEEWRAALVAWLAALDCPVLNRPTGVSLYGTTMSDACWRYLAMQTGLAVYPWFTSSDFAVAEENEKPVQVLVAGKHVIDPQKILSSKMHHKIVTLAVISQLHLCCVEFDYSTGSPRLLRLDPLLPFAAGGDTLVTTIEAMLTSP